MDTAPFQEHDRNETGAPHAAGSEANASRDSVTSHPVQMSDQREPSGIKPTTEVADAVTPEADPASDREAFDEAIQRVLSSSGGELLFRIPSQPVDGEEIAAVRLGQGEARLLALVILPQGAPLRVEPVEDSANPLAPIVQSYASLVDAWKTAA